MSTYYSNDYDMKDDRTAYFAEYGLLDGIAYYLQIDMLAGKGVGFIWTVYVWVVFVLRSACAELMVE
jgi:hypothetical protein